jgi:two-component system, OmpR family, sensor kinase
VTLSLRTRLLAGLLVLVLAGLLVADVLTYLLLQSAELGRVDQQLQAALPRASERFGPGRPPPPPGMFSEMVGADGETWDVHRIDYGRTQSPASPVLPGSPGDAGQRPFTVSGTGDVSQFRVEVQAVDDPEGSYFVLAAPLTDVNATLQQLVVLEASIGAAVLIGMALVALVIVRVGLRPLERMGQTAGAIAGGDLTRRVSPADPGTEIGRLGLALNGMLAQIESAFSERTRSEQRLRRFIADASHELRTPLTSIRGYAELLRRGAERSPDDAALARRRIEQEAVRMSVLVDDMLLLARLDQGRPLERSPVDLRAIVRDARADASAVAPARTITLAAPEAVVVSGDDMRLRQVVGNLVRNALVHTPPATPVEIALSRRDGHAVLTVADHGPGLPVQAGTRVFEPFYRGDAGRSRDQGGAGLGLSIVAAVVAAHQGAVRVADTPGGGATFEVELPLAGGGSQAIPSRLPGAPEGAQRT